MKKHVTQVRVTKQEVEVEISLKLTGKQLCTLTRILGAQRELYNLYRDLSKIIVEENL